MLLNKPNVVGIDVGFKYVGGRRTDELAIRTFVKKKEDVDSEHEIPHKIDGIKTDVIEEEKVVLQVLKVPVDTPILEVERRRFSPLVGGISVGSCKTFSDENGQSVTYVGTLGAIVQKEDNKFYALSNFHVMCVDSSFARGDKMAQPGRPDGGRCPNDIIGKLDSACLSNKFNCGNKQVDAAISTIENKAVSPEILSIGKVKGKASPIIGTVVRKQGRTTELTYGTVTGLGRTVSIDYGPGIGVVTLKNQITIEPDTTKNPRFSDSGDSGSVIVDEQNRVIGLLFGGTIDGSRTFANLFSDVEGALDISLFTEVPVHT
ncbi:S1 family peptidase [Bacillus wiedmannii]|uniref:S1 family peptidase n=1 Tax=Bacillus wiedmannii TaxID=1890302 RepID=UPI00211D3306|nr:S1 family peptidase [Bacillus wiedmannii]